MTLICEDGPSTADLYYRLHSLMLHLRVPMWVDGNVIHFQLSSVEPILTVMSYLSSYLRSIDQQNMLIDGILYSTITWSIPIRI